MPTHLLLYDSAYGIIKHTYCICERLMPKLPVLNSKDPSCEWVFQADSFIIVYDLTTLHIFSYTNIRPIQINKLIACDVMINISVSFYYTRGDNIMCNAFFQKDQLNIQLGRMYEISNIEISKTIKLANQDATLCNWDKWC